MESSLNGQHLSSTSEAAPRTDRRGDQTVGIDPFLRSRKGSAAVEFGMVVTPFMAILMVILESAYLFVIRETLDNGLSLASRQIITGQAQASTGSSAVKDQASFIKYALCPNIAFPIDCTALQVNVQQYSGDVFSSVAFSAPVANGQLNTASWGYSACGASSLRGAIMKVEVVYPVASISAFFTYTNTITINGKQSRVLYSTLVFRCEPFQD